MAALSARILALCALSSCQCVSYERFIISKQRFWCRTGHRFFICRHHRRNGLPRLAAKCYGRQEQKESVEGDTAEFTDVRGNTYPDMDHARHTGRCFSSLRFCLYHHSEYHIQYNFFEKQKYSHSRGSAHDMGFSAEYVLMNVAELKNINGVCKTHGRYCKQKETK